MSNQLSWRYRRFRSLVQRMRTSVALRGWRGTFARISQGLVRRPAEDDSLALLPLGIVTGPLILPTSAAPVVSIVIPVYGKLEYTLTCLQSIAARPPGMAFEVIVVDDASPDESANVLRNVAGLRLLQNEANLGFVGSCNAGAAAARGSVLIFLNNDTQVTTGWAEALVQTFELFPGTGVAGSQLVYPDGRLQEAGAWVFSDASAWNIGRFAQRNDPAYRYAREVDYVSGASLAIPADLFNDIGGFDPAFAPGYYEDTDLAFAVRSRGYAVRYVPGSVVVHAEGISSAAAPESGMKRFQAINLHKLADKWSEVLVRQPLPGTPLATIDRQRRRGTVLVVDISTPDASRDSGSVRLIAMMRLLVAEGWHVVFAPDDGRASERDITALGSLGVEVAARPWHASVPAWIGAHGDDLHAVVLCRHPVAMQYASFVRKQVPGAKIIFDTVDLHFLREERAAEQAASASLSRHAQTTRRQELDLIASSDATFVVSAFERDLLTSLVPSAHVLLLSNIHEAVGRTKGYAGRRDLLFIGGHGHPPNADAMQWMAGDILPALRRIDPSIRIFVAGDVPDDVKASLSSAGLDMLGRIDDLEPLMAQCLASIAPLRFGAGVKGKVNMAMSHGLPVIGSPVATEGMQLANGVDVLVAHAPDDYAMAYRRLASDEALWLALSAHGLENIRNHFSANAARDALRQAIT
ncbi:glycosyltransferase [Luteibacter aegosomatissinici]|uniref:glycosyltransferase n=1 Tax=Luteibacter aegosomatissinici TaxID=2911539 RepID=UPI001FFC13E2|nr:glycosyltransferase [Luteibacter aegosomatissinici]UPG95365.1 glycosyltransferase [Luteibacter aegosomatissinici]